MGDELLKNVPPHNLEAERAVLGALLLDDKAIDYVVQEITAEDFYRPVHATLYETMVELNNRGEPIDAVTLVTELRRAGKLEAIGGPEEIAKLAGVVPTSANAVYYAKLVRDRSLLRKLLNKLAESQRDVFESRDKTEEICDRIEKGLFEITQKRVKSEATDMATIVKQLFQQMEARKSGTEDNIKYGFPSVDDLTHGLHKGDLVIIAARPSMGKCVAADTEIVLEDGSVATIEQLVARRRARVLTLGDDWKLRFTEPSAYVDDGVKPTFRVTTRLGRVVETTATHPFLTVEGWKPLAEIEVGTEIAVPREVPVFGTKPLPDSELAALASDVATRKIDDLPAPIFTLPRSQLASLVKRIGARDGTVTSARVARQLQHLMLRLGVVARVEQGALTIARMPALVGAGPPSSELDEADAVLWDPIVSIEPLGPKQVYDLTIPDTHNFVANDICLHNTTYAINVLRNVAVGRPGSPAGHGCVFFSLEMPKVQIVSNLLCSMAKVDSHRLRGGFLSREEEQNLLDWGEVLEKQPIYIDDTPGLSVMELRGKARRLRAEGKIECILIDYLQLMQGDLGSSQKARHEVVAEISRSLKALARELEVPVIALAQLNRNVEDRPDHRPRMADLRECVTGDTLVVLSDGRRVPIRDLVGQTPEVVAMETDGRLVRATSDRVWSVGRRPVFDIRLASGRTIRTTARHRLYSATGWRRVSQLAQDDRIAVARALPEPETTEVWDEDRLVLLGHLAALLLRLGIVARTRTVKQGQYRPLYSVDVSGAADQRRFLETVGGFGPREAPARLLKERLASVEPNTNVDTLPVEIFDRVRAVMTERGITTRRMAQLRGTAFGGSSHFKFAPSRATVESYGTLLDDEVLLAACRSDLFWDRIVSITPAGTEEVFDLTVPGPASWLADGIVSHNSGSIEQDADVIMLLHRDEYYMKREQAEAENKVNKAQVLIQKNRNGPVGDVELYYAKEFSYFGELQR